MMMMMSSNSSRSNRQSRGWGNKCYTMAAAALLLVTTRLSVIFCHASSPLPPSSSSSASMIVRLRLADGSMEKIQIADGKEDYMTLGDVLQQFEVEENTTVKVGTHEVNKEGIDKSLKDLGVEHGSMITVVANAAPKTMIGPSAISRLSKAKQDAAASKIWNPYPDLAKDYSQALLKTKKRRSTQMGMSYGDIANLQSSLHMVDPQPEGPLKRVYMCRLSAERFHNNGIVHRKGKNKSSKPDISCRCGLLLGTIQKEREDQHRPKKARTSLSSTTADADYCTVAKVQAVWEPPSQSSSNDGKLYDAAAGQALLSSSKYPRVTAIADKLGLVPMGWIFSYQDERLEENKSFRNDDNDNHHEPQALLGMDVATGALLQGHNMKKLGRTEGNKFVSLAMDARTGATEAFQLSDVTVQMVHENMLKMLVPPPATLSAKSNPRTVTTQHAVLVDGRETTQLESVLCLINTAMLSHEGNFAGKTASNSVKKSNGTLTNKAKKSLLAAIDKDDRAIFEELCDFNVLMAIDQSLSPTEMDNLCALVKKWSRGQKQGTVLDSSLKIKLKSILAS